MIHRFSFPSHVSLKGNFDEERLNTKQNSPYLEYKFGVASKVFASESSDMRNTYQILQKKKSINQTKNKLHWENEEKMEPLAVITEQLTSFSHPNPKTVEGNIMVFRHKTFHAYKGSKKCNPRKSRNGES